MIYYTHHLSCTYILKLFPFDLNQKLKPDFKKLEEIKYCSVIVKTLPTLGSTTIRTEDTSPTLTTQRLLSGI